MLPQDLYTHCEKLRTYCASFWLWIKDQTNDDLLLTTFVHKTYASDFRETMKVPHNERLEFLWDSLLWSHVAQMLFEMYPEHAESQLTLSKIYLVKEATLADVARKIDLWSHMFLWNWEERSWWRDKDSVLSDWLEALIAYLFLTGWEAMSHKFIKEHIISVLDKQPLPTKSYKSKLQEFCQKHWKELPIYVLTEKEVEESGNVLLYEATVSVQWTNQWVWTGASKKKAQEAVAEVVYYKLSKEII